MVENLRVKVKVIVTYTISEDNAPGGPMGTNGVERFSDVFDAVMYLKRLEGLETRNAFEHMTLKDAKDHLGHG